MEELDVARGLPDGAVDRSLGECAVEVWDAHDVVAIGDWDPSGVLEISERPRCHEVDTVFEQRGLLEDGRVGVEVDEILDETEETTSSSIATIEASDGEREEGKATTHPERANRPATPSRDSLPLLTLPMALIKSRWKTE